MVMHTHYYIIIIIIINVLLGMEPDAQQIESNLSWFEIAKDLHS